MKMNLQEIIESIETLPIAEQDYLFELIHNRRCDRQHAEVLAGTASTVNTGMAQHSNIEELMADLLSDDD